MKYRDTKYWNFIHYNYFHKRLFTEFYVKDKTFTRIEIVKYHLFQFIDDLITLRKIGFVRDFTSGMKRIKLVHWIFIAIAIFDIYIIIKTLIFFT